MSTITREQLRARAREKVKSLEFSITQTAFADSRAELEEELELARIALASLEAEPAYFINRVKHSDAYGDDVELRTYCYELDALKSKEDFGGEIVPVYTAPPSPAAVPATMEMDDDFDSAFEHGKAVGWNACRAAMLQGAVQPQNQQQNIPENIPVTQFKPVADLFGLTSATGGETSFTFDAVEARDFIEGGWSCQEYVELERFQEAMLQGADGNSQWVACSERMPEKGRTLALFGKRIKQACANYVDEGYIGDDGEFYFFDWEGGPRIDDCHPYDKAIVTHWMYWELPAAPKGEHRDAYDIEAFGIFSATEGENGLMLQIERFRFGTEKCPQIGKENMVPKFALQGVINRLQEHCDSMGNEALVDILSTPAAPQQEVKP